MDKLERARQLGVLKDGWRYVDYCLDAAPRFGWLCCIIWGEKGSGKSATMLQHGYALYHGFDEYVEVAPGIKRGLVTDWGDMAAWRATLEHTIFRPKDFAALLGTLLKEKQRLSWCGWDDINIHFPRSMYSTNRRTWEQFSKNWEGFRANLSIFECTAPRKDKVVSFILSDMNYDLLVSSRQKLEVSRWYWDKDFFEPEKVLKYRIDIDADDLDISNIPKEIWDSYWARKMTLIDESTEGFQTMLEDMDRPTQTGGDGSEAEGEARAKDYICEVCGRDMGNRYNLSMHLSKHKARGEASVGTSRTVTPP